MTKSMLPKSLRKFLRREKSRIRRDILGSVEAENKIKELVEKVFKERGKKLNVAF